MAQTRKKHRTHVWKGESEAEVVLKWLNQEGIPQRSKLTELMALNAEYRAALASPASEIFKDPHPGEALANHVQQTVAEWRLGWAPMATFHPTGVTIADKDKKVPPGAPSVLVPELIIKPGLTIDLRPTADIRTVHPDLWNAYWYAVLLLKDDLLHRIRRCKHCATYFFARHERDAFHTDECRVAMLQSDPGYLALRAQQMRDLRQARKVLGNKRKVSRRKKGEK